MSALKLVTWIAALLLESIVTHSAPCGWHGSLFQHCTTAGRGVIAQRSAAGRTSRGWSQFSLFEPLDVVAQFERRPQLQTHVLHDHVAPQQHQSTAVNLVFSEELCVRS